VNHLGQTTQGFKASLVEFDFQPGTLQFSFFVWGGGAGTIMVFVAFGYSLLIRRRCFFLGGGRASQVLQSSFLHIGSHRYPLA